MASMNGNFKKLMERLAKILKGNSEFMKKYGNRVVEDEESFTSHKTIADEHIKYVCEQAKEHQINTAEIYLSTLQDGKKLTEEDIEQYALRENLMITGKCYEGEKAIAVRLYVGKVEMD